MGFSGGLISQLLAVNAMLVIFNMIPAFPMDGGRVFRALLAMKKGHLEATNIAAGVGKVLAIVLGVVGLIYWNNPFLIITALFVYFGAEAERRAAIESAYLERLFFTRQPPKQGSPPSGEPVWEVVDPGHRSHRRKDRFSFR